MRFRFCTRKVPGRWSLHSFFDDCSHWHQKWSVWDTALFFLFLSLSSPFPLPFLSLSSPVPFLFPFPSFTLPFPSPFLFPFLFLSLFLFLSCSFPFPFLFLFFPFRFPFLSLSFSFPFPFPLPFLFFPFPSFTLPFPFPLFAHWILWSRCEASAWKRDRTKKNVWKNIWKGSGFLHPHILLQDEKSLPGVPEFASCFAFHPTWISPESGYQSLLFESYIKNYIYIYIVRLSILEPLMFFFAKPTSRFKYFLLR